VDHRHRNCHRILLLVNSNTDATASCNDNDIAARSDDFVNVAARSDDFVNGASYRASDNCVDIANNDSVGANAM
jgi:hypothetical protein